MSKKNTDTVKARVLVAGHGFEINSVAKLTADEAAAATEAGWADTNAAAVAFAETGAGDADTLQED